jgi:hypothetical protein
MGGSFLSSYATCPTSGTKAFVTAPTRATWVSVQAPIGNAGSIYLGSSAVVSTSGNEFFAGDFMFFPPVSNTAFYEMSSMYFACSTNTDGIKFIYGQ